MKKQKEIDYFDFKMEDLDPYRDVTKSDREWLAANVKELDYLFTHCWKYDKEKTLRGISRILDFVTQYDDLDEAGDWSMVRQIVMNELLLETVHNKIADMTRFMEEEDFDVKRYAEMTKLATSLQVQTNNMIKSLGTSRSARRKDTRENAKTFGNLDMGRLEEIRERVASRSNALDAMEKRVVETKDKALTRAK